MPLNAHRVFAGEANDEDFLTALTVPKQQEDRLRIARDEIREAVRRGLGNSSSLIRKEELFEAVVASIDPPALKPKFRMQGSFSYRTCNEPAQTPPQEVDLDDGLFLPVSFLSINGQSHPAVISRGLFRAVEQILGPLCQRKGWRLVTTKPSCVRIKLSENAHIDLALYAIPDLEFGRLVEKAAMAESVIARDEFRRDMQEAMALDHAVYANLRSDQIMLAHREDGWKPSDPRKLEDWFTAAVAKFGDQLRRVSRYLKGWRDFRWDFCRLSSIALMAAVVEAYERAVTQVAPQRDDLALLMVAEHLPAALLRQIANPVVDGQRLDEGWTPEQRAEFVAAAEDLLSDIQTALTGTNDPKRALAHLIRQFGDRIPDDPDLIVREPVPNLETKSSISSPAILSLSDQERTGRAEAAARDVESRGIQSRPWSK